ncbi:MAG: glycosyltransferase [Myxococcaceae bacterium]|nr:glycosyltransferase [Myxococcaceae bacterium]
MRLAFVSPLPPAPSGVADYSAELLPLLADRVEQVQVVIPFDGPAPVIAEHSRLTLVSEAQFVATAEAQGYDAVIYQHGNNEMHAFVHRLSQRFPGVSVLHDGVLHHFVAHQLLAQSPQNWVEYTKVLERAEGPLGRRFAQLREQNLTAPWQVFLLPLLAPIVSASRAVLVHGAAVEAALRRKFPHTLLRRVRHHYSPLPERLAKLTQAQARARLGLPRDAFIVGSFGFVTPSKRVELALRAFSHAYSQLGEAHFVVVGKRLEFDEHIVDELGLAARVRLTGSVPLEDFLTYLIAVDVVVNLRYPYSGESSGSLMRALGAGKACVVSKTPLAADFPEDVTATVPVGAGEVAAIARALLTLQRDPEKRKALAERAARFARHACSLEQSADAYLAITRAMLAKGKEAELAALTAALEAAADDEDRLRWRQESAAQPVWEALTALRRWQVKDVVVVGEPIEVSTVLSAELGNHVRVHPWNEGAPTPLLKTADAAVVLAWHRDFLGPRDAQAARWVSSAERRLQVVPGRGAV